MLLMCRVCGRKSEEEHGWHWEPSPEEFLASKWAFTPDGALCPEHRPVIRKRERRKAKRLAMRLPMPQMEG